MRDRSDMGHEPEERILPLAPEDLGEIEALEMRCFTDPWSRQMLACTVAFPFFGFVMRRAGELVAFGFLLCYEESAEIADIAVAPEYRGRGYGRNMLETLLEVARAHGDLPVHLEVRASNEAAIRLYESAGFFRTGVRPGYYERPREDAILMTKKG